MAAIKKAEMHLVKDLLSIGFNPNYIDGLGEYALHLAFRFYGYNTI
jgi:hypothetical protein